MSQDKLGRAVGLTFQQIQKYEKGFNRISVGRLWEISRILNVPIAYFFEDLPRSGNEQNAEISGFGDEATRKRPVLSLTFCKLWSPPLKKRNTNREKNNIKKIVSFRDTIFFNAFKTYLCLTPVLC